MTTENSSNETVAAADSSHLEDLLHVAMCQAVALLNRSPAVASCSEAREAHTILRQALIDHANACEGVQSTAQTA